MPVPWLIWYKADWTRFRPAAFVLVTAPVTESVEVATVEQEDVSLAIETHNDAITRARTNRIMKKLHL